MSQIGLQKLHDTYCPRSKGNQAVKFDQLIEYYARNFFLQKSCGK